MILRNDLNVKSITKNVDDTWTIKARYEDDDEDVIIVFPRVYIGQLSIEVEFKIETNSFLECDNHGYWLTPHSERGLAILPDEKGNLYYMEYIERTMTLDEVEKELGYKIKIVNKKEVGK